MWVAASACGGAPTWATKPAAQTVSIYDAPPLASASYVATVAGGDFGQPWAKVASEHGDRRCAELVDLLGRDLREPDPGVVERASATCDPATARALHEPAGVAYVVTPAGATWMTADQVTAAALPIDTPAKAALVVWTRGAYSLSWSDGKTSYGTIDDARVRPSPDGHGFEVAAGTTEETGDCGGEHPRQTVTSYRLVLHVDERGRITPRERVATSHYDIADPCHPLGRRPADFVDLASGGTVHGHLVRAAHHEAESVRAFLRIARELAHHGAPEELVRAAERAANDERDHARRCAELAGIAIVIAEDALPVRTLVELAIDNAREGCVGEAYAALVNVVQAQAAATPALRAHFMAIAGDELAHAALASAIGDWAEPNLSPAERARVADVRETALAELERACSRPGGSAAAHLGLPTGAHARSLVAAIRSAPDALGRRRSRHMLGAGARQAA